MRHIIVNAGAFVSLRLSRLASAGATHSRNLLINHLFKKKGLTRRILFTERAAWIVLTLSSGVFQMLHASDSIVIGYCKQPASFQGKLYLPILPKSPRECVPVCLNKATSPTPGNGFFGYTVCSADAKGPTDHTQSDSVLTPRNLETATDGDPGRVLTKTNFLKLAIQSLELPADSQNSLKM